MFEFLNQWIQNITFYFVVVTLVLQLVPNKSYQKYIQFITGLILILLLADPILKFTETTFSMEAYQEELQEFEEEIHALGEMENK